MLKNPLLASGSTHKTFIIWDPFDGRLIKQLKGNTSNCSKIRVINAMADNFVASDSVDTTVNIWSVKFSVYISSIFN